MPSRPIIRAALSLCLLLPIGGAWAQPGQLTIPATEKMAQIPQPLDVRDWHRIAQEYYDRVLDPQAQGDCFPDVRMTPGQPGFEMKDYLGSTFSNEALTCLSAVIGSKLVGLDPHHLHGIDYVRLTDAWFDTKHGLYRHAKGETGPVVHADIYGYWAAILGLMLSAQYPDDPVLAARVHPAVEAFRVIAHGDGAPTAPNYDDLGWDFDKNMPGGRQEPMNRLGHAPSVAWVLLIGSQRAGGDADLLACSRASMLWYQEHPGRYEISHVMGPLVAARLNTMGGGEPLDLAGILNSWFGDGDPQRHPWGVTSGTDFGGLTCDGLDGAIAPDKSFYAFTMGSLQGPAWLVPVVRYAPQYARAIARYALNEANSARLLEGFGLDADHQDHAAWKAKWDPDNLFFYEGLASSDPTPEHKEKPYARGDPVIFGWNASHAKVAPADYFAQRASWFGNTPDNIALYMGNHVGFLGGIVSSTDIPGILTWDCVATDWFHSPAYPTKLIYNPFSEEKSPVIDLGPNPVDVYDLCTGAWRAKAVSGKAQLLMPADSAQVLISVPAGKTIVRKDGHLMADNIVIDWNPTAPGP